jgi:hypothetical protein
VASRTVALAVYRFGHASNRADSRAARRNGEIHLYYEVAMLLSAKAEHRALRKSVPNFKQLDRADPDRTRVATFFETTLLHCRVLDEFLTDDPASNYPDNVWAGDYLDDWEAPDPGPLKRSISVKPGSDVKTTINKQLAHFSLRRLDQATFYVDHIAEEVIKDMRTFATRAVDQHLAGVSRLLGIR